MHSFDEDFNDLSDLENSLGIDLRSLDPLFYDSDQFNEMISDISSTSDEQSVPDNSFEQVSYNIQTDKREWLVTDRISRRRRPPLLYEFLILLLHKSPICILRLLQG